MSRTAPRSIGPSGWPSTTTRPARTVVSGAPISRARAAPGPSGSRAKNHGLPGPASWYWLTSGSSALRTAQPPGRTTLTTVDLAHASISTVSIPCSPRWSGLTLVNTATSTADTPIPRSISPPRAVSRTANPTPGSPSTMRAPPGPDQSPGSMQRPATNTPSVLLHAASRPASAAIRPSSRVVVVLPFVPVTATVGICGSSSRGGSPGSASRTLAAAVATRSSRGIPGPIRRTSTRALPIASPVPSCAQGKATTTVPSPAARLTAGPT